MKAKTREKPIPEIKIKRLKDLVELIKKNKTFMIISIKGIPGNQFQEIKNKLKENVKLRVVKKSLLVKALDETKLEKLKVHAHEDVALLFSNTDAFELASILSENQSPSKAKEGQIAPEDIAVEAGPTDLPPGPAISELGAVGLKIKIEDGKIAIQERKIIARKGEKITPAAVNVMGKLNIMPFKVGFAPEVAYDAEKKKVYENIVIDKEKTITELREFARIAFGFAIKIDYICKETIGFLIRKAENEKKALEKFIKENTIEEKKEEKVEQKYEEKEENKLIDKETEIQIQENIQEETK